MLGQVIGLVLLTLLMHHGSPISLPTDPLDDTTGLRTRLYWAQLIVIVVVTPLSFVLNKVWTFAAVRTRHLEAVPPHPMAEQELAAARRGRVRPGLSRRPTRASDRGVAFHHVMSLNLRFSW